MVVWRELIKSFVFRCALALVVIAAALFWAVRHAENLALQRSGWTEGAWTSVSMLDTKGVQATLAGETAANPNIPGQVMHVIAPAIGLDATFAAGPGVRPDDDARVASNTKTFVAAAAAVAAERGLLGLDRPIGPALSEPVRALMVQRGYAIDRITLRQLLNHTAGLPDYHAQWQFHILSLTPPAFGGLAIHWRPIDQIWFGLTFGARGEPGAAFNYSDTGYLVAADMIARATGDADIGDAVRRLLDWPRLGADETFWEALEPTPPGTRRLRQFRGAIEETHIDASIDQYGGGGLVMSMDDLARATRAVVRGAPFADPAAGVAQMTALTTVTAPTGYGLGLVRAEIEGEICWGHGGFWGTSALHCPVLDLTIARSWGQQRAAADETHGALRALIRTVRASRAGAAIATTAGAAPAAGAPAAPIPTPSPIVSP